MVLNLDRLVPTPYFRSYWIPRNITQMKQYRAAVADLYREPGQFREERALLPKNPEPAPALSAIEPALETLAALAPATGVFQATRTDDPAAAIAALEDKLLGSIPISESPLTDAPDPSLTPAESGSDTDLETSIDTPAPAAASAATDSALTRAFTSAGLNAILTYSSASLPATPEGLWIPIHSAVLLRATSAWNPQTLQTALQESLRGTLTASTLGIEFHSETVAGHILYSLTGPKPLLFALRSSTALGQLLFLSDDRALLLQLLQKPGSTALSASSAVYLAGFDHASQRASYARLTGLIDGRKTLRSAERSAFAADTQASPPFFSGNLRSLSDSFVALTGEHITERRNGATIRQTVVYSWQTAGQTSAAETTSR